jgi:hypothetical protein
MTQPDTNRAAKTHGKFPWIIHGSVLVLLLAGALAPLGSAVLSEKIAAANGCTVDEGSPHPCVIGGTDYGGVLYRMLVAGWFALITVPAGGLLFLGWLFVLLVHWLVWRKGHM